MNASRGLARSECFSTRSALIVDDEHPFVRSMSYSLQQAGFSVQAVPDLPSAHMELCARPRNLVVSELKIGGRFVLAEVASLRAVLGEARLVIVTSYYSIATATRAIRLGIDAYLAKPCSAELLLNALEGELSHPGEASNAWPTLNRTMWEYVNQVFASAGSMSEAARRLGLDRRSLRRMLGRYPPAK